MTARTKAELATHVIRYLTIIDATESADTDDSNFIIEAYENKWAEIRAHGPELTYWKRDDIPPAVFLIMRDLVALEVRSAFDQPINASEKEAEEMIILKRLRRHTSVKSSGLPVRAVYY